MLSMFALCTVYAQRTLVIAMPSLRCKVVPLLPEMFILQVCMNIVALSRHLCAEYLRVQRTGKCAMFCSVYMPFVFV
jgi:hypothetical protein